MENSRDMQNENTASAMSDSGTHLIQLPRGFITVRYLQLILAVVLIGLYGFVASVPLGDFTSVTVIIGLTAAVATCLILIWLLLATYHYPNAYNYWAVLAMEILLFLVWLDAWIWSIALAFDDPYYYDDCIYYYGSEGTQSICHSPANVAALPVIDPIAAAFAGIEMILFFVSMIITSVFISRHRRAGGQSKIGSAPPTHSDPVTMQRKYLDLEKQNLEIRSKYVALQQNHLDLQREYGVARPAPVQHQAQDVYDGNDVERQHQAPDRAVSPLSFGHTDSEQHVIDTQSGTRNAVV